MIEKKKFRGVLGAIEQLGMGLEHPKKEIIHLVSKDKVLMFMLPRSVKRGIKLELQEENLRELGFKEKDIQALAKKGALRLI